MGRAARFPLGKRPGSTAVHLDYPARRGGGSAVCQRRGGADPHANRDCHAASAGVQQGNDAGLCHGRRIYCRYRQPAAGGVESGEYRFGRFLCHRLQGVRFGDGAGRSRGDPHHPGDAAPVLSQGYPAGLGYGVTERAGHGDKDPATFRTGWGVLLLLLAGFFILEPLGIPVSAIAALGAGILFAVAKRGRVINTGKVLRGAPWQIVIFSLGMYLVVYGLRNAGLTDYLTTVLNMLAERGLWAATLGTGILSAFLSSIMNNMPSVLVGALSIDGSAATGTIKEAMIYANVIGCDLGPKITPIGSLATLLWLHVLAQKHITIGWGYYFRCGITMTLPVLLVTLAALALRLSFNQP